MADAATLGAAPAAAEGQSAGVPKPVETKAEQIARYKANLGDGEREYDRTHLEGLAKKGQESARLLSKAEQRAQEASKKEAETEKRLSRLKSKDLAELRAALKEMGVDELALANAVGTEKLAEMDLSPEQKRIRELEGKEAERLKQDEGVKKKEQEVQRTAEVERHKETLSETFMQAMEIAKIPKSAARVAFGRLAMLYQAADKMGETVTPEQAADVMRNGLREEHKSLYSRKNEQGAEELDVDALESTLTEWFGDEAWKALNRKAVAKYRASRTPRTEPVQRTPETPPAPETPSRGRNFWKELKDRERAG
jgi:hypothetical protein